MARTVGIGLQDFEKIRTRNLFYVDKTDFIREWWESNDEVTLITRPRRFGKTLNMSMLECFFSIKYEGRGDLFEGLAIWEEEGYRKLQGTYPVISLSFANVKELSFSESRFQIGQLITNLFDQYSFLTGWKGLTVKEKEFMEKIDPEMDRYVAVSSLNQLCSCLARYYGKKAIILLDEYDTPMQEAYVGGYWEEMAGFMRSLFNATFKTNPHLERAVMTGVTRVSRESMFSDINNLEIVTTTTRKYEKAFGFTEREVFAAMDELGRSDKDKVREWYDGFTFGETPDIYNPWSILNYLDKGELRAYWANTSSNSLAGKLVREGDTDVKTAMEGLLKGEALFVEIDEQIVFGELDQNPSAIWSLLLASGYLRVEGRCVDDETDRVTYELKLTNREVTFMFERMIRGWFAGQSRVYNGFVKAMLEGSLEEMNVYMNRIALGSFSYFDTGKAPAGAEPEKFYHGFVLGLLVELKGRYVVTSNRESGFGRYDVMLEPKNESDSACIMEFKVFHPRREKTLEDTVQAALAQIEEKDYARQLVERGISPGRIYKYGFAFEGQRVLIGRR